MADARPVAVAVSSSDPVVVAGLRRLERDGLCVLSDASLFGSSLPTAVVVDLDSPSWPQEVRSWRQRSGSLLIAGHLAQPDAAACAAAERAGCDVVSTRGGVGLWLRRRLLSGRVGERRWALVEQKDIAGRLGLVARFDESPVGPVALFNLGSTLVCISDVCPHAQSRLSDGAIEDEVLTCPSHGSQFDLRAGERVRGPSDLGVTLHSVVEEEGRIYLVLPVV
ncbi:MAG: Rieske (2Fe-2S) protein [Acidimicrobiales bacterium]